MVALLQLCEPSRRGIRVNWNIDDEDDLLDQPEGSSFHEEDSTKCPTDVCIICCGISRQSESNPPPHKFPSNRLDSLRCHLINTHLRHAHNGLTCNWETCQNVPRFTNITEFLAHASTVHSYDVNIKLCHLPETSTSVDFEIANIDPQLSEPHPAAITKPSLCQLSTETAAPSLKLW